MYVKEKTEDDYLNLLEKEIDELNAIDESFGYINFSENEELITENSNIENFRNFFSKLENEILKDQVILADYLVKKREGEEESDYQSKKDSIKKYLYDKKNKSIYFVTVKDYSKDWDELNHQIRNIYSLGKDAVKNIVNISCNTTEKIVDEYEKYEKKLKEIDNKLKNDIKDHKRNSFLNVDTCLRLLDDNKYSKKEITDIYSDFYDNMKEWYKIAKDLNEDSTSIENTKLHYVRFLIKKTQVKMVKWITFFYKHQIIEIAYE